MNKFERKTCARKQTMVFWSIQEVMKPFKAWLYNSECTKKNLQSKYSNRAVKLSHRMFSKYCNGVIMKVPHENFFCGLQWNAA